MSPFRASSHWIRIGGLPASPQESLPEIIVPLVRAVTAGLPVEPELTIAVKRLGFDTFTYAASTSLRPDLDGQLFMFSTVPIEWSRLYEQEAYQEIDPRVHAWLETGMPFIWDQSTERGKSDRIDRYLDDAARFGVRSGVSFQVADCNHLSVMVCFNSPIPIIDYKRQQEIEKNLGEILIFAWYFHEKIVKPMIQMGLRPLIEGAPLSPREKTVIALAACGLTTEQVAAKLGIKPRTAQFHFDAIRSKLGVASREEAVARAVHFGVVDPYDYTLAGGHAPDAIRASGISAKYTRVHEDI